jgi:drug/metabolite transporter (DMT)-like permease
LGHSSFNWALAHLPASYVSIALLGEPISSTILAYFLLGEVPGSLKILGAGLILVGILVATHKPVRKSTPVYNKD